MTQQRKEAITVILAIIAAIGIMAAIITMSHNPANQPESKPTVPTMEHSVIYPCDDGKCS
jgi:hypothetical protein